MAKDRWDKFKISSDALKANWPILLMAMTVLGSGITNASQYITSTEKDELTKAMKDQIEILVDYKPEPVPIGRGKGVCNCNAIFSSLIKKHEKKHELDH